MVLVVDAQDGFLVAGTKLVAGFLGQDQVFSVRGSVHQGYWDRFEYIVISN